MKELEINLEELDLPQEVKNEIIELRDKLIPLDKAYNDLCDKNENFLGYQLPDNNKEHVAQLLIDLVNRVEVEWRMTLTVVQVNDFWKSVINSDVALLMPSMYEYTISLIATNKFKGYDQCLAYTEIDEYFKPIRKEYAEQVNELNKAATEAEDVRVKIEGLLAMNVKGANSEDIK